MEITRIHTLNPFLKNYDKFYVVRYDLWRSTGWLIIECEYVDLLKESFWEYDGKIISYVFTEKTKALAKLVDLKGTKIGAGKFKPTPIKCDKCKNKLVKEDSLYHSVLELDKFLCDKCYNNLITEEEQKTNHGKKS